MAALPEDKITVSHSYQQNYPSMKGRGEHLVGNSITDFLPKDAPNQQTFAKDLNGN